MVRQANHGADGAGCQCGPKDTLPKELCHNDELTFMCDRSSKLSVGREIVLQRLANAPLSRREANLWPASSPSGWSAIALGAPDQGRTS